ncbi:MAG: hypothetical protein HQK61_02950 [Desulfamplus sp.]|nr:hypothetical protein [Desulfamplus sp.]
MDKFKNTNLLLIAAIFIVAIFSVFTQPSPIEAEDILHAMPVKGNAECIVDLGYGSINWTTGTIQARGRSLAKKNQSTETSYNLEAARNSANDNLVEILKFIGLPGKYIISKQDRLLSQSTTSSETEMSSHIHTVIAQIKKKAMNANIVKTRQNNGGSTEMMLETNMYGEFLQSVLPPQIKEIPEIELFEPDTQSQEDEKGRKTFHENQWIKDTGMIHMTRDNDSHTGIIIDARSIRFKPVLYPVIVSEQGQEIYGPMFISRKYAAERGVCTYICSLDPALTAKKAGKNPVMIKGLRKDSERNNTIVISMSDADKIQKMPERHLFMKGCRVVIVISP